MAEPRPVLSNSALHGAQTLARHYTTSVNLQARAPQQQVTINTRRHSVGVTTVPIQLVFAGPTQQGSRVNRLSVPLVAKVGPAVSPRTTFEPLKKHASLTRLYSVQQPQQRPVFYVHNSPRVVRSKPPLPEKPPSYEQIFNVISDEKEPVECPSVLVTGSPRKEKKRSLRSKLLRHLTGKRAAAQAARRSRMTAGSHRERKPPSSPVVQTRQHQVIIKPVSGAVDHVINVVHTPPSYVPSYVHNDSRFISAPQQNRPKLPTLVPQNGFVIGGKHFLPTSDAIISNHTTNQQVILLHTVPEESVRVPSTPVSVNTSKPSAANITTSVNHTRSSSAVSENVTPNTSQSSHQPSVFIHNNSSTGQESFPQQKTPSHCPTAKWSQNKVPVTQSVNSNLFSHEKTPVTSDKSSNGKVNHPSSQCSPRTSQPENCAHDPKSGHHKNKDNNLKKTEMVPNTNVQIDKDQSISYTLNLKPGMYKLNLNFANAKDCPSQTINITVPSEPSPPCSEELFIGKPPPAPEQLYYDQRSKYSLPQRFVQMLKPSSVCSANSKNVPKVTLVQHHNGNKVPQVITVVSAGEKQQVIKQETSAHRLKQGLATGQTRSYKKERLRLAERKKAEGNESYRNKEYRDALQHYTQAIELCPECAAYYSNRSACNMMLGKYREALTDARKAVTLDASFVKGWLRVGKCHVALGEGSVAVSVLRQALELDPHNSAVAQEITAAQALQKCVEESNKAVEKKDYRTAVFHLDQALRYALGGLELRISRAEYLALLGRVVDAEDIVNDILMSDGNHADALYVRGLCRYYQDNQDAAFQHFQKVLRLVPDHRKAKDTYKRAKLLIQKKEQGNAAFKMGDFAKAMEIYSEALDIDDRNKSTNAKLFCNRATVAAKLGRLEQSITDCTAAITLDDTYVKAYLRRSNTFTQTEMYEEAVQDLEKVYKLQRTQDHKRLLQDAKAQLKRSKRKDYYKILGVSKTASDDEIKKAYRKMALLHHPDRHSSASEAEKAEHEKKFKELGEAYAVLTDPKKRAMHDRGQDVNDPDCGFHREGGFDPNQVFATFFGPDYFQSQSHHFYEGQGEQGQGAQQQGQGQYQGQQFQGQHFQGFQGMPNGFQFGF